ncbi:MAG TPA: ATP-binding cassette domain-containing protein [Candidatus Binatia bacterium]|nr:ATP-binding cassette domain-containing protein [Candidatus Binatia bacterium]
MDGAIDRTNGEPVVRVDQVSHFFGDGDSRNQVLFRNCISIDAGQLVILTGPSGSGKTTLLSLIGALRSVQDGAIRVLGQELAGLPPAALVSMRRNIGFIFQAHNLFESLTALENVKMAMQLTGMPAREMRARGVEMLERLGLGHRVGYLPRALSGGQRQRVAVARAVVSRPKLVLADEPTAALDKESSSVVISLLKRMTVEDGATVIIVTHDNRILDLADRIVNMVDGSIVSDVTLHDAIRICELLRATDLFKQLTPAEITNIAEKMTRRVFRADDVIIREGDPGDLLFLIGSGEVDVSQRGPDGRSAVVATVGTGRVIGERALIVDEPRNATCAAATEVEAFSLAKADFIAAIEGSASFKNQIQSIYFQRQ